MMMHFQTSSQNAFDDFESKYTWDKRIIDYR